MAASPPLAHTRLLARPAWVLLTQLFLALGWLRAATAHLISADWWSGDELGRFLADNAETALPMYDGFAQEVVGRMPVLVSTIVVLAEIAVGVALILDWRPTEALAVGIFLNVHFLSAGAVDPSVFYLIIGLGLVVWHQERGLTALDGSRIVRQVTILALATTAVLAPQIGTVAPARVVEDPAVVLIFLGWLVVLAFWSISVGLSRREVAPSRPAEPAVTTIPLVTVGPPAMELAAHPSICNPNRSRVGLGLPGFVAEPERRRNLAPLGHGGSAEVDRGGSGSRGLPRLLR